MILTEQGTTGIIWKPKIEEALLDSIGITFKGFIRLHAIGGQSSYETSSGLVDSGPHTKRENRVGVVTKWYQSQVEPKT